MAGGIVFFVNLWIRFVENMKCLHRYHKIVKEIYKSQVYYVKNKTFINFALKKKEINMVIARQIKEKLPSTPAGVFLLLIFVNYE